MPIASHRRRQGLGASLGLLALLLASAPARGLAPASSPAKTSGRNDVTRLFRDEMQQAAAKIKWRGERLSEETVYALALTGASWETAWGKDHLFSLAWGDCRKLAANKRSRKGEERTLGELRQLYSARNYTRTVSLASASFSLEEIGCDPNLKESVGRSFLAMGQPERAFPIFAAPFEAPSRQPVEETDAINRRFREAAFEAAQRAELPKEAIAFGLSLLLEPGDSDALNREMLRWLEDAGVDIEQVALGILQAPRSLRGLSAYEYAAADLLVYRAQPRLLPFFLHLANSDDVYLRSRALLGAGILSYRARSGDPPGWAEGLILRTPREYSVSAGERKLIEQELREAVSSDKYRLRAAAALALALIGEDDSLPILQKLAKDRAYLLSEPEGTNRNALRRIAFPVREAATAGLARFGLAAETGGGVFAGKALEQAKRGGQDVTNDRRDLRRDVVSQLLIFPLDISIASPHVSRR